MSIQKILIVDDSKTELFYLSDLLTKHGFKTATAENADAAMARLAEDKPDLILMDVVMPGLSGFHLTRSLSKDPHFADVPVIICSSKDQETDKIWAMRQGAKDYVTKPVNAAELLAKIRALSV